MERDTYIFSEDRMREQISGTEEILQAGKCEKCEVREWL